ncbi:hypothetical protein HU200_062862 [Digitaria exilis]|uniref:Uncharacterized protein n=1 Tax=Digitaria exilis TaxID=1010633 RepID=A0A835DXW9_9POAL|nr:hypothetical protein HU200_062862 [Digitaria exilis]
MPPATGRWRRAGRSAPRLLERTLLVAALSAAALMFLLLLQHHHSPKPPNPSSASRDRGSSDELPDESLPAERDAEVGDAVLAGDGATCATVERMGEEAAGARRGSPEQASLRVREMIRRHFELQDFRVVEVDSAENIVRINACIFGLVLQFHFRAALSRGLYPFGEYISYTNHSFTIHEIKHLWRKHRCARTYGRDLNIRVDVFENPPETNVLCSDWNSWKDPIIWFDGTTDAVGIQFFLKNVHPRMKAAASALFGLPDSLDARPNTFGELMRTIISPSSTVQAAVNWALKGVNPDIVLHMRMMANRPVRARKAAVLCIKRALQICCIKGTPRVALVSDTPAFVKEMKSEISEFAEVIYFDYKLFTKTSGLEIAGNDKPLDFRSRDWGSAPRWVAFVDFFLAAQARYAVVTGAHRRVGTTYAQLIAALAAANRHGQDPSGANFTFLSSIHSNLLVEGLSTQVGWGHIWNRYAGPLSCRRQPHQCSLTPILPPAWWDGKWQSPIPRDVRRLLEYGVRLSNTGEVDGRHLISHCRSRKDHVKRYHVLPPYKTRS